MSQKQRGSTSLRNERTAWLFALPAALFFLIFMVIPIGYALYLSVRGNRLQGSGPFARTVESFVGFSNYLAVLSDNEFLAGLGRVLKYGLIFVPIMLGLALLFALLIDSSRTRFSSFGRIAIFLPYAVPGVIASLLWGFMYLPSTSPFSYITKAAGMGPIGFFNYPALYFTIANIGIWSAVGFNMIIIYTSLRSIPREIHESARIDGANERKLAFFIKIPLVTPALFITGLFSVIGTLQLYNEPATLRPLASTITWTWVPLMKIYQDAFFNGDLGFAAAASVLLAAGTLCLSLGVLKLSQRRTFGD